MNNIYSNDFYNNNKNNSENLFRKTGQKALNSNNIPPNNYYSFDKRYSKKQEKEIKIIYKRDPNNDQKKKYSDINDSNFGYKNPYQDYYTNKNQDSSKDTNFTQKDNSSKFDKNNIGKNLISSIDTFKALEDNYFDEINNEENNKQKYNCLNSDTFITTDMPNQKRNNSNNDINSSICTKKALENEYLYDIKDKKNINSSRYTKKALDKEYFEDDVNENNIYSSRFTDKALEKEYYSPKNVNNMNSSLYTNKVLDENIKQIGNENNINFSIYTKKALDENIKLIGKDSNNNNKIGMGINYNINKNDMPYEYSKYNEIPNNINESIITQEKLNDFLTNQEFNSIYKSNSKKDFNQSRSNNFISRSNDIDINLIKNTKNTASCENILKSLRSGYGKCKVFYDYYQNKQI